MKNTERRQVTLDVAKVEIRNDGESKKIVGYSAVFYREGDKSTEYWLWDDYVERLQPGCFDRAISENHDARGLYNHDPAMLLGRVSNGTCSLSVDETGLRFEIPFDENDPDHVRVRAKIDRGDLSGCSFAFVCRSSDWQEQQKADGKTVWVRNITDLDLYDVGPVTYPAYEATEVGIRTSVGSKDDLVSARSALIAHRTELENHLRGIEIDQRLRMIEIENH